MGFAPRFGGQQPMSAQVGLTSAEHMFMKAPAQFLQQKGLEHSHAPSADITRSVNSVGALMLAAMVGAVAGVSLRQQRAQAAKSRESETEMTASSMVPLDVDRPKFAVAPFVGAASAKPFDPLGLGLA